MVVALDRIDIEVVQLLAPLLYRNHERLSPIERFLSVEAEDIVNLGIES